MKHFLLTIAAAALFSGCAGQQQVAQQQQRFFFPTAEEAKIEYLGTYQNNGNIESEKESLMDKMFGAAAGAENIGHNAPFSIAAIGQKVFVSDINRGDVLCWDFAKKTVRPFGSGFSYPTGVAIDGIGNVYISDRDTRKIFVFDKDEKLIQTLDLSKHIKSALNIAIDRIQSHLIVADSKGCKISVFNLSGKHLFSFGEKGGGDGEFNVPVAVAVDKRNSNILVADTYNARIQVFTADGKFLNKFGSLGDNPGEFGVVKGIGIDSQGNTYISDGKHRRVSIFNDKNELLYVLGDTDMTKKDVNGGTTFAGHSFAGNNKLYIGGFILPQGIYVDEQDSIFIADSMNHAWQAYQLVTPEYLAKHPIQDKIKSN